MQVIVYDKRAEVIAKRKVHWWPIWNATRAASGQSHLDPSDRTGSAVWRAEVRAGKSYLTRRWKIRTWHDLETRLGDLVRHAVGAAVRYKMPSADSNRTRWPDDPFWRLVQSRLGEDLAGMQSGAEPETVREVIREEYRRMLVRQSDGLAVSLAVSLGLEPDEIGHALSYIRDGVLEAARDDPARLEERFARTRERLTFG